MKPGGLIEKFLDREVRMRFLSWLSRDSMTEIYYYKELGIVLIKEKK